MVRKIGWLIVTQWLLIVGVGRGQSFSDTICYADWRLYWSSEFSQAGDSSTLTGQWQFAYPWGRNLGGYEDQYYTGAKVAADSGMLHLRAQRRLSPRPYRVGRGPARQLNYESGMIFSRSGRDSLRLSGCSDERTGFAYGLFEIRCRLPRTPASFSSFWLYGNPDEVDVFETGAPEAITNNIILWSHQFWRPGPLGAANEASQSIYYWAGPGSLTDDFHTFAVSWQPQELVYYFDGVAIRRETRLLPLGCPLDVISNLGMYNWSKDRADSLDIDYIRVYKTRALPRPPAAPVAPAPGILQVPRSTAAVLGSARAEQRWLLQELPNRRPRLMLHTNLNPRDFNTLALPSQGRWLTPLTAQNDADSPQHWVASPDSGRSYLSWTLYDLRGFPVRSGEQPPALAWSLNWPDLPPGAYCLRLWLAGRQVRQIMYQLGRPTETVFTPEWLATSPGATEPKSQP